MLSKFYTNEFKNVESLGRFPNLSENIKKDRKAGDHEIINTL